MTEGKFCIQRFPDRKGVPICVEFGNSLIPIAYIQRAKHTDKEIFEDLIRGLEFHVIQTTAERVLDELFRVWEVGQ